MKDRKGEHPFGDAGQLILLLVFLAVWIVDSFVLHPSRTFRGEVFLVLRLAGFVLCCALAWWLLRSGSEALRDANRPAKVLATGAFRRVRHPLYLAELMVYIGLSLATLSWPGLILTVVIFFFLDYIARFEEKVMASKFGEEYEAYKARTGRWFPRYRRSLWV